MFLAKIFIVPYSAGVVFMFEDTPFKSSREDVRSKQQNTSA